MTTYNSSDWPTIYVIVVALLVTLWIQTIYFGVMLVYNFIQKEDEVSPKSDFDIKYEKQKAFEKKLAWFFGVCLIIIAFMVAANGGAGPRTCGQYDVDGVTCSE